MADSDIPIERFVEIEFLDFVADSAYPCVGAKAALKAESIHIHVAERPNQNAALELIERLEGFETCRGGSFDRVFSSFVLAFSDWAPADEDEFEAGLFQFLQLVHDLDHANGHGWDSAASSDPNDRFFGFSINSRAYFLVGMHPQSSRLARSFSVPAIVFNSHFQFAELRRVNAFDKMRDDIRRRDKRLQGSYNPEMVGSKEVSETRQYSGKRQSPTWHCPLKIHKEAAGET